MSIVDMFSDLVIGLATLIFWRMLTAAPAKHDVRAPGLVPALSSRPVAQGNPARALPLLLDDICEASGLDGVEQFMAGAARLYEALLPAFASGDIEAQRPFLADEVYQSFRSAIEERNLAGESTDLTFIGIEAAEIADASLSEKTGRIAVRFTGLVVTVTRDSAGKTISGNPKALARTMETWTFARDLAARHADWMLIATEPQD